LIRYHHHTLFPTRSTVKEKSLRCRSASIRVVYNELLAKSIYENIESSIRLERQKQTATTKALESQTRMQRNGGHGKHKRP